MSKKKRQVLPPVLPPYESPEFEMSGTWKWVFIGGLILFAVIVCIGFFDGWFK